MAEDLVIQTLTDADEAAFFACIDVAFHEHTSADARRRWRALLDDERTAVACEGDRLVGTSGAFAQRLSVPGGELPCAAVTVVTVLPTHRRRGILTRMMGRLLEQARAAGEPLAALWAAEGGIYERFGYGVATYATTIEVPGGSPPPRGVATPGLRFELLPLEGAAPLLQPLWDGVRAHRAGLLARDARWWAHAVLSDPADGRSGALEKRLVVARDGRGAARGYALYRARPGETGTTLEALELIAPEPGAEAALWGYLTSVDLVRRVRAERRPLDDPLPHRLADFGRARMTDVQHALWLRLVDVPAALAGRAWAAPLDLTLRVTDARLPHNDGTWRVEVSREGEARASATDRAPDLVLDVAALGAAYLGGTAPARLADAGRIEERGAGALERLAAALRTPRAPWAPEFF